MTKPRFPAFPSLVAILFACATVPAFAQHGGGGGGSHGGGGGGGFHGGGGGGFHGGGGGGFHGGNGGGGGFHPGGGGGFHGGAAPPPAGAGAPQSRFSPPMRPGGAPTRPGGGSFAPPSGSFSRPGGTSAGAGGMQRGGNSLAAPPAVSDGRWHSFGGPTGSRGPAGPQSAAGPSATQGGGFHTFGSNRAPGPAGVTRSFSGQGREVWENAPLARNVVPSRQALSSLKNSVRGSGSVPRNLGGGSNSSLFASSRFSGGTASARVRDFSGTRRRIGVLPGGSSFGGFGFGNRFNGGCWNCGFGFGGFGFGGFNSFGFGFGWWPGWGWGWPSLGWWGWDPFWYSPWWGWGSPGYSYGPGYAPVYIYNYPPSYNDSTAPPTENNQNNNDGNYDNGGESSSVPESSAAPTEQAPNVNGNLRLNLSVPVLIYMKDGSVFSARDYWITNDEFNLVLMDGGQKSFSLDQVDLPRTNDENAKSGVKFILKSDPTVPLPGENLAPQQPSLQPDGSGQTPRAPAPSQQTHPTQKPDART